MKWRHKKWIHNSTDGCGVLFFCKNAGPDRAVNSNRFLNAAADMEIEWTSSTSDLICCINFLLQDFSVVIYNTRAGQHFTPENSRGSSMGLDKSSVFIYRFYPGKSHWSVCSVNLRHSPDRISVVVVRQKIYIPYHTNYRTGSDHNQIAPPAVVEFVKLLVELTTFDLKVFIQRCAFTNVFQ